MTYKIKIFGTPFRQWELIKNGRNEYGIVINIFHSSDIFPNNTETEYQIKNLSISKYWLVRKVQLWAIKLSFK